MLGKQRMFDEWYMFTDYWLRMPCTSDDNSYAEFFLKKL